MLTGVDQEGKRIVAADFNSAHQIRLKYAFGSLQCPFCKQSIFPRATPSSCSLLSCLQLEGKLRRGTQCETGAAKTH